MNCVNPRCKAELEADHVLLVTTTKIRRFCHVGCLIESHEIYVANMLGEDCDPVPRKVTRAKKGKR